MTAFVDYFYKIGTLEASISYTNPPNARNQYSYNQDDLDYANEIFSADFSSATGSLRNADRDMDISLCFDQIMQDIRNAGYDPEHVSHFSALKMHHGIQDDHVETIFEPAYFNHENGTFNLVSTGQYYTLDTSGAFGHPDVNQFNILTADYRNNIRIVRHDGKNFPNTFLDTNAGYSENHADVKFCVITLQQLLRMHRDNQTSDGPPNIIHFKVVARAIAYINCSDNKLHVLAYRKITNGPFIRGSYKDLGADFTQMSPPNPPASVPGIDY